MKKTEIFTNKPLTSREYKIILNSNRFPNLFLENGITPSDPKYMFAKLIQDNIQYIGGTVVWENEIFHRETSYLDTNQWDLKSIDHIVRLRFEPDKNIFKLTFKYRSNDIFKSSFVNVSTKYKNSEEKFEEDITSNLNKFSSSCSIELKEKPVIKTLKDIIKFFPGIEKSVDENLGIPLTTPVNIVNGFVGKEICVHLFTASFSKNENFPVVKFCLSFWNDKSDIPVASEFSFDFDFPEKTNNEVREFVRDVLIPNCDKMFKHALNLKDWVNLNATTKTALAYTPES